MKDRSLVRHARISGGTRGGQDTEAAGREAVGAVVARVEIAAGVADDLDRIFEHLQRHAATDVPSRMRGIVEAIAVLEQSPLIGRPAARDKRQLVIGRGTRGYVALYRYVVELDTVFVLAIRGQREAGYRD